MPDAEDEAKKGNSKTTGLKRWNSLKEIVNSNANATQMWNSVRKSVADGGFVGKHSIERMKEFKLRASRGRSYVQNAYVVSSPPFSGTVFSHSHV